MKFNFRKITSVIASAVMATSTAAMALAASYPAPFVVGGTADGAIVYTSGSHSGSASDYAAAVSLQTDLNSKVSSGTGTPSVEGGDYVKFEKSSTKLWLGKGLKDVLSVDITDDKMPNLLADGTYVDSNNDEFDYSQKITMANLSLTMWEDSDYKEDQPTVGIKIPNGAPVLNYTLDFTETPNFTNLETTDLTIMGKNYYVLDVDGNSSLTLLDSAASALLAEGETTTLDVDGKSYEVSISFVGSDEVKLEVNGELTNALEEGETYKLSDGSYLGIKDILYTSKDTGVSKVEFSIGSGKLELTNGDDIEMNDDSITDLKAYLGVSGTTELDSITIEWKAEDDLFVTEDSEITMPGFGAVKLSYGGMYYPAEETITVAVDGDDSIKLDDFPLKDSTEDISILYGNSTNYIYAGKDSDSRLLTAPSGNITFNGDIHDYFVASWSDGDDAESYLMRATNFKTENSINKTTFQYRKDGSWVDAKTDAQEGDTFTIGNVELTVGAIDKDDKTVVVAPESGVDFHTLYSKEGMKVYLPWINETAVTYDDQNYTAATACANLSAATTLNVAAGQLGYNQTVTYNSSGATQTTTQCSYFNSTYDLIFSEEDKNENKGAGDNITVRFGFNSASTPEVAISDVVGEDATLTEIGDTDEWRSFMYSALATEILWDKGGDQDSPVKLIYHGDESYGNVYLTDVSASVAGVGGEGGTIALVKDTEVDSVKDKNLIVIGGSCINSVAAQILGVSYPTCGSDFTAATGVGAGQHIIKAVKTSEAVEGGSEDKVAVLVAGYESADTVNAVNRLKEGHVTDVGTEAIYPQVD